MEGDQNCLKFGRWRIVYRADCTKKISVKTFEEPSMSILGILCSKSFKNEKVKYL